MALTLDAEFTKAFGRSNCEPLIYARIDLASQALSWAGTVSDDDTSVTLTTGTTVLLAVGMEVRHANIPANTTIDSITDATHFELSAATTGAITTAALTIVQILHLSTGPSSELDAEQIIESVTPITKKLDPYSRKFTPGEINLKCLDDGTIRYHNGTYPLKGKTVRIWLSSPELTLLESASFFVGVINEVTPVEGAIEIQCRNFFELLDQATFEGDYYCKHPLVVIKQLLEHGGIDSAYIDANSFDPAHADHAAIRHYTITSVGMDLGAWQKLIGSIGGANYTIVEDLDTFGARWQGSVIDGAGYPGPDKPVSIIKLINHLVFYLSGMIWFGEDGKIYFKSFDKTESTAAHLTTHDYADFKQLTAHEHIANDFTLAIGSHAEKKFMRVRDTAAITACGTWPKKEAPSITTSKMKANHSTSWLTTTDASVSAGDALSGFIHLLGLQITGCTGTQGTTRSGSWTYPSGSAAGYVTSDYPLILEWRGEIIKATTIAMQTSPLAYAPNVDDDGTIQVTDYSGIDYIHMTETLGAVKVTAGVRGFASTTPVQVTPGQWFAELLASQPTDVNDWTMIYNWVTDYAIPRFSHGLATMEITTPLSNYKIEVGDLISIDNDVFLWRNNDGLSNTSKLEVIGKEVDPFSDQPRIKFTLAMANPANAPSNTISYTAPTTDITSDGTSGGLIASIETTHVGGTSAQSGLTLSDGGSLNVLVDSGAAVRGTGLTRWDRGIALTNLTASKENFVTVEPDTGVFYVYPEAANAIDPNMTSGELQLGVATTDGSSLTGFTDERALGGISGLQIDSQSIESGRNLVSDGAFPSWPNGGSMPCRGWELALGTWGTDAMQERQYRHSGRYSVHMPNTGVISTIDSDYFSVMPGELYDLSYWSRVGSTSLTVKGYIRYYDAGRTYLSQSGAIGAALGATDTWERLSGVHTAPATAAFARVRLLRYASVSECYFDDVTLALGTPSFAAHLSADSTGLSAGDVIPFASEAHDYGSNYNTGTYKFTAPNQGRYTFTAMMVVSASSISRDSQIQLVKDSGGSVSVIKSLELQNQEVGLGNYTPVTLHHPAVTLNAGDLVYVTLSYSGAGQLTIEGTASTATLFSGRLIR